MQQQENRGSTEKIKDAELVFRDVFESEVMQDLWKSYQKKFSFANDVQWEKVMEAVNIVYQMMK